MRIPKGGHGTQRQRTGTETASEHGGRDLSNGVPQLQEEVKNTSLKLLGKGVPARFRKRPGQLEKKKG